MFLRIMMIVGLASLVLALIMLARGSHTITPPLSDKPLGKSMLSHEGPSAAPPSKESPDRSGSGVKHEDGVGGTS
jgi:hypothetical protein